MPKHEDGLAAALSEIWCRVLGGEDADAVLADFEQRDAARRVVYAAEIERLQAEADFYGAIVARHDGRLQ